MDDSYPHIVSPSSWTEVLDPAALFPEPRPLAVDIGCGKGRYIVAEAARRPHMNFLGIDRLLARLRKASRKAAAAGLTNVRFLRIEASYALEYLLPEHSVAEFTIFFPDPWPKRRHHRRRLLSTRVRDLLDRALQPGGAVHFATDHEDYFNDVTAGFRSDKRFQSIPARQPRAESLTTFETLFRSQGATINRASYARVADRDQE